MLGLRLHHPVQFPASADSISLPPPRNAPYYCMKAGPPHEGRKTRQSSGTYNMHVLKEIYRCEESALKELAEMFQVREREREALTDNS